jgi:hypothetical protein
MVSVHYICESLLAPWVSIFISNKLDETAKLQNANRGVTSIKSLSFSLTTLSPVFTGLYVCPASHIIVVAAYKKWLPMLELALFAQYTDVSVHCFSREVRYGLLTKRYGPMKITLWYVPCIVHRTSGCTDSVLSLYFASKFCVNKL